MWPSAFQITRVNVRTSDVKKYSEFLHCIVFEDFGEWWRDVLQSVGGREFIHLRHDSDQLLIFTIEFEHFERLSARRRSRPLISVASDIVGLYHTVEQGALVVVELSNGRRIEISQYLRERLEKEGERAHRAE
jgi:hypothetical protein